MVVSTRNSAVAATAGQNRPVVEMSLDEAVKFALDRNLDIAGAALEPADQRHRVCEHPVDLPPGADVLSSARRRPPACRRASVQVSAGGAGTETSQLQYNGGIAQSVPWGGGAFQVALNNQPRHDHQQQRALQSGVPVELERHLHAAAAPELPHRLRRGSSCRSPRSTATSRTCSFARRSPTRCRTSATPIGTTSSRCRPSKSRSSRSTSRPSWCRTTRRASRSARWRRSTSSRRSREQATRRQNLVTAQSARADDRARAEAADRRRHQRSRTGTRQLDPIDRPDFRPEPIDIEAAVRRALSERTDLGDRARRPSQANDVTLKFLHGPDCGRRSICRRTYGLAGIGGP